MENIDLCKSSSFQEAVARSLALTRDNHPREAAFSCWLNLEGKAVFNEPILGEDYSFRGHHQAENRQQPFTGSWEGEGSQTILDFHTHPGSGSEDNDYPDEKLLSPSIADISCLLFHMKLNRNIAELFGREGWINPISVIGSPVSKRWSLLQIDPTVAYQVKFEAENLWGNAVWKMFERYHPRQAKRGTGPIADLFGPRRDALGAMFGGLIGNVLNVPRFLRTSPKRYQEFMAAAGVDWILIDPAEFPTDLKFSYKIDDLQEKRDVYNFDEDGDDLDFDED